MHSPKYPDRRARSLRASVVTASSDCPIKVTTGRLSDEVLLRIFRYFVDSSPRVWPVLVHICRKWRYIVFASHQALHLRLFCTHGTPVLKSLDCWPALPIVVEYGGSPELNPPLPEDEENILAALKQSDRVNSIHLTLTVSLLNKLSSIEGQFSELEDLVLLSQGGGLMTVPRTFRWAPCLRRLHSTSVTFSAPLRLLLSSRDLIHIHIHDVDYRHLSPKLLAHALSGMAHLQSLSLHVISTKGDTASPPPPEECVVKRVVIPSLSCLKYRGSSHYLNGLLASLGAPRLADIGITFPEYEVRFNPRFNLSNLSQFIDRTEMQNLRRQADIIFSFPFIAISLTQSAPTCLKFQVLCVSSYGRFKLSSITKICRQIFVPHHCPEEIRIKTTRPLLYYPHAREWETLLYSFNVSKRFRVTGDSDTFTETRHPLRLSERRGAVAALLPDLRKLCICEIGSSHPPLREAAVSLMVDCRLSGHLIEVEYERLSIDNPAEHGTGPFSQQVTIEILSDDILLETFRHYLDRSPQFWPTLAHACQRWRQIVFMSPRYLDLRLYCTYGTPVLKTLDYWPPFPLVLKYGGSSMLGPPDPEDEENIVAALKQSDHIRSISLTVTSSLVDKLSTISEPFTELEEITLLSRDSLQLTLPSAFRWGPRLRTLHSTRIAFTSFPELLLPSQDLVDLQLHEIPSAGYFSPEAFVDALSGITQIRSLSLHFLSSSPRRNYLGLPPTSEERIVLPALSCLKYRGTSKYLDSLVSRIDSPDLRDIDITFFSQPTMDASQLGRFIARIEMMNSPRRADILTSEHSISVSFTQSNGPTRLELRIKCEQFDWQLSSMTQICNQFSPFLFHVEEVLIDTTRPSSGQDDLGGEQCLELIHAFSGAKDVRVAAELVTNTLAALSSVDILPTLLPALRNLHVQEPKYGDVTGLPVDLVGSLVTGARQLSSCPVQIRTSWQLSWCECCTATFSRQEYLYRHMKEKHPYQVLDHVLCPYCCVIIHSQNLFQEHLARIHPELALT